VDGHELTERLIALRVEALEAAAAATDEAELDVVNLDFLGRKSGRLLTLTRGIGSLSSAERPAVGAVVSLAVAVAVAPFGAQTHLIADAARHLLTVGFLTSVVVAMSFRLIPVLERVALPWPGLRRVAFWALLGGVALRTAEFGATYGAPALGPLVPLSGALVWVAVACVAANLARAITAPRP